MLGLRRHPLTILNATFKPAMYAVYAITLSGCAISNTSPTQSNYCSDDWYQRVSTEISTGDHHGHGPDIGSMEWRSVIEFKLGIREDSKVPPLESEQWCQYIDTHYINKKR